MKLTHALLTMTVAIVAGACLKQPERNAAVTTASAERSGLTPAPAIGSLATQTAGTAATGGSNATSSATSSRDVCALISNAELARVTGFPIERTEKTSDGCRWFANAAARQQRGQDEIRSTFEKMATQEPSSFQDGLRSMEGLIKGAGGLASSGLLFTATVQWTGADEAEATLQTTTAVLGAGLPGGQLEPVQGLGDRAFMGPMGSLLYVRKGAAWLELDLRTFPGSREQALQIARRLLSKI
jgi:hypothetical protein